VNGVYALSALIRKEFLQVSRDRRMMMVLLFIPVVQVTIFGYAANLELTRVDAVVVDDDRTDESRRFVRALSADQTFHTTFAPTVDVAERSLRAGDVGMVLIVPRGWSRVLDSNRPAHVQVLVDGSDPSRAQGATAAVDQFITHFRTDTVRPGAMILEPRLLFNPGVKSGIFMVPGTAAAVLAIISAVVTAMGLTREREVGTLEQLFVTPIPSGTLMLGKTIPYAIFGLVDEAVILVVGNLLFGVPVRSVGLVFVGATAYLVCTLAMGLFIATVARTQQQALMGGFFFLLPAILLSGFLSPIDSMPLWVHPLTWINPVRYFVDFSRSVLVRGSGAMDVMGDLLALAAMGAALLTMAAIRFRRSSVG